MMKVHLSISSFRKIGAVILRISVCAVLTIGILGKVFLPMQKPKDNMFYYYQLEKNTVDVLFIGSSHVYCSVNPLELYLKTGVRGYDLAMGSQAMWHAYYVLKEALKTQTPKVVMLDVYMLKDIDDSGFAEKTEGNLQSMRPSWNKYEALKASEVEKESMWDIFWGFPMYHDRYGELEKKDYVELRPEENLMGYSCHLRTEPLDNEEVNDVSGIKEALPISDKAESYLRMFIELCQQKDIQVVLINSPWPDIDEEAMQRYNYVENIAKEYQIDFLNGCRLHKELAFDWTRDRMDDGGHLNYYGSLKWTDYLADYLSNSKLKDYRPEGSLWWQKNLECLQEALYREEIQEIKSAQAALQYLMLHPELSYAVSVNTIDPYPEEAIETLGQLGMTLYDESAYILKAPDGKVIMGTEEDADVPELEYGTKMVGIDKKSNEDCIILRCNGKELEDTDASECNIWIYNNKTDDWFFNLAFDWEY